jgi:hypothetical protein
MMRPVEAIRTEAGYELLLTVADLRILLWSDQPDLKLVADGGSNHFDDDGETPDIRILVTWGEPGLFGAQGTGHGFLDPDAVWQVSDEAGGYRYRFRSPLLGPLPYKIACFNRTFTRGTVFLNRAARPQWSGFKPLEHPLADLVMLNLLAKGRGIEVRACGVADAQGQGHLFIGETGTEHRASARIWQDLPGVSIFSDDRIVLRQLGETIWMYGAAWQDESQWSPSARAPLRHVYFLKQGAANALRTVSVSDAASRLFACTAPLFRSPEILDFTVACVEAIVQRVPAYELTFLPDSQIIRLIPKGDHAF